MPVTSHDIPYFLSRFGTPPGIDQLIAEMQEYEIPALSAKAAIDGAIQPRAGSMGHGGNASHTFAAQLIRTIKGGVGVDSRRLQQITPGFDYVCQMSARVTVRLGRVWYGHTCTHLRQPLAEHNQLVGQLVQSTKTQVLLLHQRSALATGFVYMQAENFGEQGPHESCRYALMPIQRRAGN